MAFKKFVRAKIKSHKAFTKEAWLKIIREFEQGRASGQKSVEEYDGSRHPSH